MKYYGNKNISERLAHAEEIITTVAIDEAIRVRLSATGYGDARIAEMQQLVEDAKRLETNQQVQVGKQIAATNALYELTQAIRLKFISDRKMTRLALKNNPSLSEELRLHIKTKPERETLVRQMRHFYEEVVKNDELMERLAAVYDLTAEVFTARLQDVDALMQAMQLQQYQIGQVRLTTRERREAMDLLDEWMRTFIGIARLAFREEAGNLKKLSIYSQPRSRPVTEAETPPDEDS